MSEESFVLVGYWNGDKENWTLTKSRESEQDVLVSLDVEEVPVPSMAFKERELRRNVKKVSRELRGFIKDLKKIK